MENFRYLLATLLAVTLITSVVSNINPSYFAGLNAYAEDSDGQDDSESNNHHDDKSDGGNKTNGATGDVSEKHSDEGDVHEQLVQSLGNHSKATLEPDNETELGIEIQGGDLADGTYNFTFTCDSPDINKQFNNTLVIKDGEGKSEQELYLANNTYTGCGVQVDELSATFPTFSTMAGKENEKGDNEDKSNDHEQDDHDNSSKESNNQTRNEEEHEHNERMHKIVNSTSGAKIHESHKNANPASPGEYKPNFNYTLEADGNGVNTTSTENVTTTVGANMSVWKSNSAIVLLDVVGGTIHAGDDTYEIKIGYAIYSIHHNVIKLAALAVDDNNNIFRLKLQGTADGEDAKFPTSSGSVDLTFEGSSPMQNSFGNLMLTLDGTVSAD